MRNIYIEGGHTILIFFDKSLTLYTHPSTHPTHPPILRDFFLDFFWDEVFAKQKKRKKRSNIHFLNIHIHIYN
jgi:hypothetical protein